ALTDRGQSVREPPGAGCDRDAADHGDHVARGALGILEPHLDTVYHARRGGTARAGGRAGLGGPRGPTTSGAGGAATAAEGGVPAGRSRAPSARDGRELDRPAEHRGELARDPLVAQQVGPVGGDVDRDLVVAERDRIEQAGARSGIGVELEDARLVLAQPEP